VLLGITAFWSTSFVLVKDALAHADPVTFLALRFGVGALACTALAWREGWHLPSVVAGARLSPFLFGGYVLQTAGLAYTTPARSAFLTGMCVLLVPFVAWGLLRRVLRWGVMAGVGCAAVGMYLMTLAGKDAAAAGTTWLGDLLTLGCAISYAFHVVLTDKYAAGARPGVMVATQVWGVFLFSLPLLTLVETKFESTPLLWGVVAYTGVLSTAVAISLQTWAQARTTAVRAALVFALEPVFTAAFGWSLGREHLTAVEWLGGVLIVAGVVVGELTGGARADSTEEPCSPALGIQP
jgi:drug/metabolite transporter (DMT)-like permease